MQVIDLTADSHATGKTSSSLILLEAYNIDPRGHQSTAATTNATITSAAEIAHRSGGGGFRAEQENLKYTMKSSRNQADRGKEKITTSTDMIVDKERVGKGQHPAKKAPKNANLDPHDLDSAYYTSEAIRARVRAYSKFPQSIEPHRELTMVFPVPLYLADVAARYPLGSVESTFAMSGLAHLQEVGEVELDIEY